VTDHPDYPADEAARAETLAQPGGRNRLWGLPTRFLLRFGLLILALAVVCGLTYLTVSADGFIKRSELEREKEKLAAENEALSDENQLLRLKIEHLRHDPNYVEDEARKKLGLIRPGETV
jgi:cell division protein FtsB